jgi:glycopeptide antibiotics resistance protein
MLLYTPSRLSKLVPYWKTIAWSLFLLVIFLMPSDNLEKAPHVIGLPCFVHFFSFAVFTWLFLLERTRKAGKFNASFRDLILAAAFALCFGLVIEILQKVSGFGRTAEFKDVVLDLSGILLALFFFRLVRRRVKPSD